ncbi:uncharacterized protein N7473_004778 [Penicillium subrubescens]|uniref:DNA polymerase delta subunit 3 n=1 Tax=Penicillium subrubescens TaxID=1316194 RepID=A0A1Q5ULP3_9EURO|nr:uncharacterized protein N7473_004778 [Penicillium subrubescens]KAJ5900708.1 hypothetical protein N7473_004778 [Penicillium subrubescens]OKP13363.1 DNA polymerase delta subunit 3 [Penicillium subrubescens]
MDATRFLAENVLNERRTVTYRSLSRALKVHAHRAKQILFEFHRIENAKKPQSVHATYLISGIQNPPEPPATNGHANDEDAIMQSSPYLPSSMPNQEVTSDQVRIASVIIAREEDLEDAKATFQSISMIHVYSVQPSTLQDLNTLTDVCREMATAHAQDDPLECGPQWGMIQNRNVKRRTGARPPPARAAAPAPKAKLESTVPAKRTLPTKAAPAKLESKPEDSQPASDSQSSVKSTGKPAAPKREKSNLFSSFAKTKPPKPKPTESATQSAAEDVMLDDASEEEQEELFPDSGDKVPSAVREGKKEREEKLKKMMEDDDADDEEMADADEELQREPTPEEQPPPPPPKPAELKEEVTVQDGRRRGKRQVMKKRTVKDAEGYLVTREEATWESFSEDEPAPPKKKPAVNVAKAKTGKPGGQGSIMSFFGKK